jgi:putative membrane protein
MFYMASGLLDGFNVKSFGAALIGSLLYSVAGMIIEAALERVFKKD